MRKNKGYVDEQFANPVARIDIATGQGFCRIREVWSREDCVSLTFEEHEALREKERQAVYEALREKEKQAAAAAEAKAEPAASSESADAKPKKPGRKCSGRPSMKALRGAWGKRAAI